MPAATLGSMCVCVGPPDSIVSGQYNRLMSNKPAARMGDSTAHGGKIVLGCPTVGRGNVKLSLFIVLIIAFVGANAMSKNNKRLFSAISGTITLNGKPVANKNREFQTNGLTSQRRMKMAGFSMPSVFDTSISNAIRKFVPSQFVSPQTLYVYVDGMEYQLLRESNVKRVNFQNHG